MTMARSGSGSAIPGTISDSARRAHGDRVVLKIGTSSLVTDGHLDPAKVDRLCEAVLRGRRAGLSPVLVTSGAIAIGRRRHDALAGAGAAEQQVSAALGQGILYSALHERFSRHGLETGQILLTPRDLISPGHEGAGGVGRTLDAMESLGFIPIVNENDALGVRNNDVLAAVLSGYLRARLLLLLTNVPGIYDANPMLDGNATRITEVRRLTPGLEALAGGSVGDGGTGGMVAKLSACWIATYSGVPAVIADTEDPGVLVAAHRGDPVGTRFQPRPVNGATVDIERLWRAFRTPPRGTVVCEEAGLRAIDRDESLLRSQVREVSGSFDAGSVVDIAGVTGGAAARGAIRLGSGKSGPACAPSSTLFTNRDYVRIVEDQPCR